MYMSENEIQKLWNRIGKGKYLRINKKDGSLPSIEEFQNLIRKNA